MSDPGMRDACGGLDWAQRARPVVVSHAASPRCAPAILFPHMSDLSSRSPLRAKRRPRSRAVGAGLFCPMSHANTASRSRCTARPLQHCLFVFIMSRFGSVRPPRSDLAWGPMSTPALPETPQSQDEAPQGNNIYSVSALEGRRARRKSSSCAMRDTCAHRRLIGDAGLWNLQQPWELTPCSAHLLPVRVLAPAPTNAEAPGTSYAAIADDEATALNLLQLTKSATVKVHPAAVASL